jgi:hypothetical protein
VPEQLSEEARQKIEERQAFIQKVTSIKTNEQKMLEALEAIRDTLNVLVAMARAQQQTVDAHQRAAAPGATKTPAQFAAKRK